MTFDDEQETLLKIVETWRLSEKPEYRGFRCANCQQYKNEAWYHWVNSGGYKLPIHLCDDACESSFQINSIQIDETKIQPVNRETFGNTYKYTDAAINRFRKIIESWPVYEQISSTNNQPQLNAFTCDECNTELKIDETDGLRKGYHVWWKMDDGKTLAELHFHRECATQLGITE